MFNKYLGEFGTLSNKDYATGITTNHHGRIVDVQGRCITILKLDGSHFSSGVDWLRLDNPGKFLRV